MFKCILGLPILLLCTPTRAPAQAGQHTQQESGAERIGGDSEATFLLVRRSEVGLSEEQIARLERIQAEWVRTRREARERLAAATARLRGGAPSPAGQYEIEKAVVQLRETEEVMTAAAIAVLTTAQRQALGRP